jgi:hypothetical protein
MWQAATHAWLKNNDMVNQRFYTEAEAAAVLGISLERLHRVLDQHIFNDGTARPPDLELLATDLVLLRVWIQRTPELKVVPMSPRSRSREG